LQSMMPRHNCVRNRLWA